MAAATLALAAIGGWQSKASILGLVALLRAAQAFEEHVRKQAAVRQLVLQICVVNRCSDETGDAESGLHDEHREQ